MFADTGLVFLWIAWPVVKPSIPRIRGKPNLNGIWESLSTANWVLQDHSYARTMWETWVIGSRARRDKGVGLPARGDSRGEQFCSLGSSIEFTH